MRHLFGSFKKVTTFASDKETNIINHFRNWGQQGKFSHKNYENLSEITVYH